MNNFIRILLMAVLIQAVVGHSAKADILVAPTRVVFEDGERSAELVVVNKGQEEAAFRISVENRRMDLFGALESAPEATEGEQFAKNHIRYSPRRMVLSPGEKQTVRVAVSGSDLQPGEYRSHLRLKSVPTSANQYLSNRNSGEQNGISIQLIAIRSLTIPIIIRAGKLDANVDIIGVDLVTEEQETLLKVQIVREGNKSVYGLLEVYAEGAPNPVLSMRGVAVYTPNSERRITLPVSPSVRDKLRGRHYRIVYRDLEKDAGEILAEFRGNFN